MHGQGSGRVSATQLEFSDPGLSYSKTSVPSMRRGLDVVLGDLASHGYDASWTSLRASDVGAAHPRDRWFCVAYPAIPDPESIGRTARRSEPEEQQGGYDALPGHVVHCLPLMKTPTAQLGRNGAAQHPEKRKRGGHGPTLDDEVSFLLPHADSERWNGGSGDESETEGRGEPADSSYSPAEWWGDYLPAIRRWEGLTGVPAPAPTEVGPRSGRRLTATFAEWLMGLPAGHVTDVPGLSRAQQLKAIGNGVCPQQAHAAYAWLIQQ